MKGRHKLSKGVKVHQGLLSNTSTPTPSPPKYIGFILHLFWIWRLHDKLSGTQRFTHTAKDHLKFVKHRFPQLWLTQEVLPRDAPFKYTTLWHKRKLWIRTLPWTITQFLCACYGNQNANPEDTTGLTSATGTWWVISEASLSRKQPCTRLKQLTFLGNPSKGMRLAPARRFTDRDSQSFQRG